MRVYVCVRARACVQVCGFAAKLVACRWSVVGGLAFLFMEKENQFETYVMGEYNGCSLIERLALNLNSSPTSRSNRILASLTLVLLLQLALA